MNELTQEIIDLIDPVLNDLDLELVDLDLRGNNRKRMVRVYVYQQGGVTLDKCETASRQIAEILDRTDPIPGRYVLEVSSPGLDRPLKNMRDFQRNLGEKIKVVLQSDNEELTGTIESAEDDRVTLQDGDNQREFNIKDLGSAKIIIEF